jgi:4-hydroxy-4-methyl-2-oxoglutarate aldolase
MYTIKDMPAQIDKALLARLAQVEAATVGHWYHDNIMDWQLLPAILDRRVAGTAVTVRAPAMDGTMVGYALGKARPGDFLVIDRCGDRRHACWGCVTVRAAKNAGIAGVVIDGLATDLAEIRAQDVPLWCLGESAITVKKVALGGAVNVPVSCGGIAVNPGDAVLADETGILVLDPADVAAVTDKALAMQEAEIDTMARLDAGETYADISGIYATVEAMNAKG